MSRIAAFMLLAGALTVGACAKPAQVADMTTAGTHAAAAQSTGLSGAVVVSEVVGGEPTSPMFMSKVSSEDFRSALTASLAQNKLLASSGTPGRYKLKANLIALSQPLAGFDMTVRASVRYTMVDSTNGAMVFEEFVSTSYTATMGDTLIGVQRLRLANQGAIKQNIDTLIRMLVEKWPEIRAKSAKKAS